MIKPTQPGAAHATATQAATLKAAAAQAQPATAHAKPQMASEFDERGSTLQATLIARRAMLDPQLATRTTPWSYEEMIESPFNQALIETSAAAIRKTMLDKGQDPSNTTIVFGLDITGRETSVCTACNIEGHDYKPKLIRRDNPEINMLDEYFAITRAIGIKAGLKFGMVVWDEEVLPVRGIESTNSGDYELNMFRMFRQRHAEDTERVIVNGVMQGSMAEELARWKPEDATTKKVGEPDDGLAFSIIGKMMAAYEGNKWTMVAKSQAPVSIRPYEAKLRLNDIKASSIAVGEKADQVAPLLFKRTQRTYNMHGLKAQIAPAVLSLVNAEG